MLLAHINLDWSKLRKIVLIFLALSFIAYGGFLLATQPKTAEADVVAGLTGDAARGALVFAAGGCASCHAAPEAKTDTKLTLAGGRWFPSPFGTFVAPNISSDPEFGIGDWSAIDLVNAMKFGTSPDGAHYYPAFPYGSYSRVSVAQIVDLKTYLDTLPSATTPNQPHQVGFPFNIRRILGVWKLFFMSDASIVDPTGLSGQARRGQMLVEGLGHCGECHSPRNFLGGIDTSRWLAGAPNPTGKGRVPNLTPHKDGLGWSTSDIAEYLKSGFTPEFDTAGDLMADVIENTAKLSDDDRLAIAAYLKALPPVASKK